MEPEIFPVATDLGDADWVEEAANAFDLKEAGNMMVKVADFDCAKHLYSEALDKLVSVEKEYNIENNKAIRELKTTVLNNRGMVNLKGKNFFAAIRDFTSCISLCQMPSIESQRPSYMRGHYENTLDTERKSLYRRSLAYRKIGNTPSAIRDILSITRILPKNSTKCENPTSSQVYEDLRQLGDANRPYLTIHYAEQTLDQRLNCYGAGWKAVAKSRTSMPNGRRGHSAVLWNNGIYVLGGSGLMSLQGEKFEVFDLTTKVWKRLPLPKTLSNLDHHTAVVYKDKMIVLGGNEYACACSKPEKIWQFCFKDYKWCCVCVKGDVPGLVEHSACVLGNTMYVFGGRGLINNELVDHSSNFYALDLDKFTWRKISGTDDSNPFVLGVHHPEPRCKHAMWADKTRNRIYILGGTMKRPCPSGSQLPLSGNSHAAVEDMWYYDLRLGKWYCQELYGNVPVSRQEFTAVPTSRGAVLFGGFTTAIYTYHTEASPCQCCSAMADTIQHCAYLNDIFEFVNASDSFCQIQTSGKPLSKRAGCVLVIDDEEQLYAVHGYHGTELQGYSDIHCLDLKKAHLLNPPPTVRTCGACERTATQEKLRKCNGICDGKVWYCSSVCQRKHWPEHKKMCGKRKE